jgi:probable HAF family extracellular repeat protein
LGGSWSYAQVSNDIGTVVGESALPGDVVSHAFAWTHATGMVDLGSPLGGESIAYGVNNSGMVVGQTWNPDASVAHAFVWTASGGTLDITPTAQATATGVTDGGIVIGSYFDGGSFAWTQANGFLNIDLGGHNSGVFGANGNTLFGSGYTASGVFHAFVWTSAKGVRDLGTLGGPISEAFAMNSSGLVVGESQIAGTNHAFVWSEATGMVDLGTLGGRRSFAYAVNDNGMVIGISQTRADVDYSDYHAFVWTATGGMQDLGTLGGTYSGVEGPGHGDPTPIDSSGRVTGFSALPGDMEAHAFLWSQGTGMLDLGTPGRTSSPTGMSDNGVVVGQSYDSTTLGDKRAFAWTPTGGLIDLTLGRGAATMWTVTSNGIATGFDGNADAHAFVWTPSLGILDLGTFGGPSSYPSDAHANGNVVGWADTSDGSLHAFSWYVPITNTPSGTNVSVQPTDSTTGSTPVTIAFSDVTQAGTTTLVTTASAPAVPTGFTLGSPAVFYELQTTAVFSGSVLVCIDYSRVTFNDTWGLVLFHYEGAGWVDRTVSLDATRKVICASVTSFSPFAVVAPIPNASIQPPVNADGSSVFTASRGVVPMKFSLAVKGQSTCTLPTATINVVRTAGGVIGALNESVYSLTADSGSTFRISECQYIYNVNSKALGAGTYRVDIKINARLVGSAGFQLK